MAGPAAVAARQFFTKRGRSREVSVVGEIVMASVLGGAMAMAWKTFHWNTRSHIADVYAGRVKGQ